MDLLTVEHLSMKFGGLKAIDDVSLSVAPDELVAIIGPNGAGKTTLFNTITGIYAPTVGTLAFNGQLLKGLRPNQITHYGIARTFQNIRLFNELSVIENIKLAKHTRIKYSFFDGIFKTKKFRDQEEQISQEALELLELFNLLDKKDHKAKNLSYGQQRRLEIARALATNPKLLLLDEPAAGMNPTETKQLSELIQFIRVKFNVAIVLIEHDMNLVMDIAQKIYVLNYGKLIASGNPKEIQNNPNVIKAYLGDDFQMGESL